ncbi:MAG: AEC family transporter [Bradyrhizobiaceae bacterium]|nr:AEC family transporter [Bradyrhizobiaceae bacterium]
MLHIADIVLPVFGVIAFGYVCAWTGLLRERVAEGVSDYVYTIAIPLLIFRTLSEAKLPEVSPWGYWGVYFAGAAVSWTLAQTISLFVFRRDRREAIVHGLTSAQSNIVLVGIPLVLAAVGEAGAVPLFLLVAVNLPIVMAVASLMMEATGAGLSRASLFRLVRTLATNLILIGFAAGLAAQFLGIRASGPPKAVIDLIAQSSVPCALFAMGLALRRYGVFGDISMTSVVTALKLFVHPLVVWLLATFVVPLPPVFAAVAVLFASMPCGINAYLLAERYQTGVAAAAGAVSLSTTLSVLSISFWLWMIGVGVG